MNDQLRLKQDGDQAVEIHHRAGLLFRYVYRPETLAKESSRPFAHPVRSLSGATLSCFRPNDHPWHHGLSFTINHVGEKNFWGGPSYRAADGYQWRDDHGIQKHLEWLELSAAALTHRLQWRTADKDELLLEEVRSLEVEVLSENAWALFWRASLKNVTGSALSLGNYHSRHGLTGSHYTGLQFRGARDLLDEHGDASISIAAENGLSGEVAIHGAAAGWMEWNAQKDENLQRVNIRFINNTGPIHWFVRQKNPLTAFPFQFDRDHLLAAGAELLIDHSLIFTDVS
ncbi:hypothetical protein CMV30_11940 [Nibricoccus aquaticus]|uniref:Oxidoreductase n=1 Tax=Nibricoccus aquaticus TaxID=2576891 RepID=A0A290Q7H9_9BACT|nr:DUF6807 family protein [Nibricoccus aquaticus]ATC64609.1 hypothetical protein CMV30_11940 [Nibricoccus aquaticus]